VSAQPLREIHRLFNHQGIRRFLRKFRVPLAVAAGILLIARVDPAWFLAGLGVSLAGEAIQLWCFGTLHKKKDLAANGPYALVRNPMYLGRYFLILGALMLSGNPWLLAAYTVLYSFYMRNRVRREEETLRGVFGEPYAEYCAQVSRFLPSLRPYRGNPVWTFQWDLLLRNNGHWNFLAMAGFYAIAWAAAFLRW
jgi:protein-S-isoprenylcysteine O-methyltransferase Ste14